MLSSCVHRVARSHRELAESPVGETVGTVFAPVAAASKATAQYVGAFQLTQTLHASCSARVAAC